jgi:hypothetical protein
MVFPIHNWWVWRQERNTVRSAGRTKDRTVIPPTPFLPCDHHKRLFFLDDGITFRPQTPMDLPSPKQRKRTTGLTGKLGSAREQASGRARGSGTKNTGRSCPFPFDRHGRHGDMITGREHETNATAAATSGVMLWKGPAPPSGNRDSTVVSADDHHVLSRHGSVGSRHQRKCRI